MAVKKHLGLLPVGPARIPLPGPCAGNYFLLPPTPPSHPSRLSSFLSGGTAQCSLSPDFKHIVNQSWPRWQQRLCPSPASPRRAVGAGMWVQARGCCPEHSSIAQLLGFGNPAFSLSWQQTTNTAGRRVMQGEPLGSSSCPVCLTDVTPVCHPARRAAAGALTTGKPRLEREAISLCCICLPTSVT